MDFPNFLGARRRDPIGETNIYPINQDDVPTRPQSHPFVLNMDPPPGAAELRDFRKEVTGAPPSTLAPHIVKEIDYATNIVEMLLELEPEARERVIALQETMMDLYAPKPAEDIPDPQGNPV